MSPTTLRYSSPNLSFQALTGRKSTIFSMHMINCHTTHNIPQTLKILKKYCPHVLRTECINPLKLPFHKEVLATQLPHLFEHILIAELCRAQIKAGYQDAEYSGRTTWVSDTYPPTVYMVRISAGASKMKFLQPAIDRAIKITEKVLGCVN